MTTSESAGPLLAVMPVSEDNRDCAGKLALELDIPLLDTATDPTGCRDFAALLLVGDNLALQLTGNRAPGPVAVDFGDAAMRHRRRAGHNELLGRAIGVGKKQHLAVLDATAGLGRDSFVLADLGCRVVLCEREPVIARMLAWGLARAGSGGDPWLAQVAARMELHACDVRQLAGESLAGLDVIYLDPMFPARDKSAAVKKEMALFQLLLQDRPDDGGDLLTWALDSSAARVVVKRPSRAPFLGGHKPSHDIIGRAVRYDVYVRRALL